LHSRDVNTAINIKKLALIEREEGLVDLLTEVRGMKQEVVYPSKT